jgi:queuine tRNA-ribosyltransferase
MNLRNAAYRDDPRPLDENCGCYACRSFSRAYLRHLVMAKEILGFHLLTVHNLFQLEKLTGDLRAAVASQSVDTLLDSLKAGGSNDKGNVILYDS